MFASPSQVAPLFTTVGSMSAVNVSQSTTSGVNQFSEKDRKQLSRFEILGGPRLDVCRLDGQERRCVAAHGDWAQQLSAEFPFVSRALEGVADSYRREAQREDLDDAVTRRLRR
jgi:hypothetical protein